MKSLIQDLRYGVRTLRKSPGFTLMAVLTLAFGIGANTAIFSAVNAVLLRSLPLPNAERLVWLDGVNPPQGITESSVSAPDVADWQNQNQVFDGLSAFVTGGAILSGGDSPERVTRAAVSENFFSVIGVRPALGRAFLPEEDRLDSAPVAVISHGLWQRRFGGDPNIIGKTLTLSGRDATIIGVMPSDFKQPSYAEAWTPLLMDSGEMKPRESRYFTVTARLKPSVTLEQARAEMNVIASRLEAQYQATNTNWGVRLVPLHEQSVTGVRPALLILLGAVGFVLLIACVNVANLLLARATARHKEMAIRTALGATRRRIVRQLLIESLLLALLGGSLGMLLSLWGVDAITALVPSDWRFPRLDESRIDASVLLFTLGVSVLTGLFFGLLPALKASKLDVYESLKETGRGSTAGLRLQRLRGALVISEIALTLLLLVGAGLLMKSLLRLQQVDLGFNPQNVLTLAIVPPLNQKYLQPDARATLYRDILEKVEALPEVESVAASSGPPLVSFGLNFSFAIEGRAADTSDKQEAFYSAISPDYFRTMGVPLLAGRDFTGRDNKDAPSVAIINETMRRRYFVGEDPIGQHIKIKHYMSEPVSHEIVGVARDTKQMNVSDEVGIEMYAPHLQYPWLSTALVVRTKADPLSIVPSVQRAVSMVDKNQPITAVKTMDQLMSASVAQPRFYTLLLGVFAVIALVLASVGIYGVMSYSVAQRTHEIGVRVALGAQSGDVLRLVLKQGMKLTFAGIAIGLISAALLTRVMSSLLYGVSATDPSIFILISLLLMTVALLACYIPARRAMRVDPMIALRYE